MKTFCTLLILALFPITMYGQLPWTETFENNCPSNCTAASYTGPNGSWTVSETDTNYSSANEWYISCREGGESAGCCAQSCSGGSCNPNDESLHVGQSIGDFRTIYDRGVNGVTNKRVESPVIDCSGYYDISINFNFIGIGDTSGFDKASFVYSPDGGSSWLVIDSLLTTLCCSGAATVPCSGLLEAKWTLASYNLPNDFTDNPNIKIGFEWTNNGDGEGSNTSFAVDDITISGTAITADFSSNVDSVCTGDSVLFNDLSTGPPKSWVWTFIPSTITYLDSTSSTSQNPVVSFDSAGTYSVALLAGGSNNVKPNYITINKSPSVSSSADQFICFGDSATLTAYGNSANSYSWAPATGLNNSNSMSTKASPAVFTEYIVTATDSMGCQASDTVSVFVNMLPAVDFSASPVTVYVDDTVKFTNSSSDASSYSWDFGDGSGKSTLKDPAHVYGSAGNFTVKLTATSDSGCVDSISKVDYITVSIVDGKREIFNAGNVSVSVFPNPVRNYIHVKYYLPWKSDVSLTLFDIHESEIIHVEETELGEGTYSQTLNTDEKSISAGFYFIALNVNGIKYVRKVAVIK